MNSIQQNAERPKNGNTGHLSDFVAQATTDVRKYQQKMKRAQYAPQFARFKLKFYYLDGNTSVHYSYDFYHKTENGEKKRIADEEMGFVKLIRCVTKNNGKFLTAVIWCVMDDNTDTTKAKYNFELAKFVRNRTPQYHKKLSLNGNFFNGRFQWKQFLKIEVPE